MPTKLVSDDPVRAVLIDDDETDRVAVRRALAACGARVELVEHRSPAEAWADVENAGIVLIDYLLPGVNALELLPELRRRAAHTPVIVLTNYGDEQVAVELLKAGVSDYFAKDRLDGRALWKSIRQAVALRNARATGQRAEQTRHAYMRKLRELVDQVPGLYRGRSTAARVESAAQIARTLVGARDVFVAVHQAEESCCRVADADGVHAPTVASPWHPFCAPPQTAPLASTCAGEPVQTYAFSAAEARWSGVIAVRGAAVPVDLVELLLAHLGENLIMAIENVRLLEVAGRALEARDAVMALVSHDLRAPLNAIGLGVELLRDGGPVAEAAQVLDRMARSTAHMKRLIADLLDVAAIENRELSLRPSDEAVTALLDDASAIVAPQATAAAVSLEIAPAPAATVRVDRQRVAQVLSNLLSNALKFSPAGSRVALGAEVAGAVVRFAVRDHGPGIGEAQQARIFERFFREDGRGLGLGLYIARALVEGMGGRIWVESAGGQGACFYFTVPRAA